MKTNFRIKKEGNMGYVCITPNYLRNLFISEKIHDAKLSMDERHQLAKTMGHSLQTQEYVYSKYSKEKHPEDEKELTPEKIPIKRKKHLIVSE
jgi:hypothetical protein